MTALHWYASSFASIPDAWTTWTLHGRTFQRDVHGCICVARTSGGWRPWPRVEAIAGARRNAQHSQTPMTTRRRRTAEEVLDEQKKAEEMA